jgi:hypothetical protein
MSSKQEHPIQAMGFWMFGFLSVVLAVLKLTVAGYWSWWRVMLPFLAFLGHNAVYLLAGFLCFCWLKHEEGEEEPTTVQKHSREGYNLAALLFFFLFLDNLLRRVEGQGWKGFWPCSGRFEVVVLFGMLSLVAQFVCWSGLSAASIKSTPETLTVTFEEFSPTHDFFDYKTTHHRRNGYLT